MLSEPEETMPLDLSKKTTIIGVVVVAVIIFIGAMVGTSLRKLSTEEGKRSRMCRQSVTNLQIFVPAEIRYF